MSDSQLSEMDPGKFCGDYDVAAWGADRHGTLEYALQRSEPNGMTRYAIVAATPMGPTGGAFMVDVVAGAEHDGSYGRYLVLQSAVREFDVDTVDHWFRAARDRADKLESSDLGGRRIHIRGS